MNVILPQRSEKINGRKKEWPVLWLLHGLSDNHTDWMRRTSIERYAEPLNLAVVMPSVNRSFYLDMHQGPQYGTFMREELPRIARSMFPLSEKRKDNFVAGLSMGGYGAFLLALSEPQKYAAAASLSGVLDLASHRDDDDESRINYEERYNIFGPIENIPSAEQDLMALAEKAAQSGEKLPALYQCCGTEDDLIEDSRTFHNKAQSLGLDIIYDETDGDHDWDYWDQMIQRVLQWLPLEDTRKT